MKTDRLEDIEAALNATRTPPDDGDWEYADADWLIHEQPHIDTPRETWRSDAFDKSADGPFIVAAHNDYIPWLIAEVKRLRELTRHNAIA